MWAGRSLLHLVTSGVRPPLLHDAVVLICASQVAMVGSLYGLEVTLLTCACSLLARTSHSGPNINAREARSSQEHMYIWWALTVSAILACINQGSSSKQQKVVSGL